jgi:hypothetical protein
VPSKLADTGAKIEAAGDRIAGFGWTLTKIGCSGFVLVVVVIVAVALLSSGGSSTTTTPAAPAEAPKTSKELPAGIHECAGSHETYVGPNTSCTFAEKARFAFAAGYETTNYPPAEISAYNPTTNRESTLDCVQLLGRKTVECTTGTAAVLFPDP